MKESKFQIQHHFYKKITALIHKNVIGMFVSCTIYEIWISSLCCFGVNQPFCYVVFEHLHNLEERASCLAVFYFRVESLGFSKPESLMYEFLVPSRDSFTFSVIMIDHSNAMQCLWLVYLIRVRSVTRLCHYFHTQKYNKQRSFFIVFPDFATPAHTFHVVNQQFHHIW